MSAGIAEACRVPQRGIEALRANFPTLLGILPCNACELGGEAGVLQLRPNNCVDDLSPFSAQVARLLQSILR